MRVVAVLALAALGGCAQRPVAPLACEQLPGARVPAEAIALPTRGAIVTSATVVSAAAPLPEYCKVLGSILPVDPAAPPINFELDLPSAWNGKAMMFGGGGFNGTIPNTAGNVPAGAPDRPAPLARGYAVFASDSGHQSAKVGISRLHASMDASFALNDEARRNFTGDALKKTRDTAMHLIRARYAVTGVERAYFAGGSTGGREALQVALTWPQDWDGVIAWYPAWNHVSLVLQVGRAVRALAAPGAWPNPAKRQALRDAALAACDKLDGVADGIVSNVAACDAAFDVASLRCRKGADTGDRCLSDAQLRALRAFSTPLEFQAPLASGETHYPGYVVDGADLGLPGDGPLHEFVRALALGTVPPGNPLEPGQSPAASVFWDQWVRYVFAGDPAFDALSLDPQTGGALRPRIDELSRTLDQGSDYSAFAGRGGKLLMAHGAADVLISARSTAEYYERIRTTMGAAKAREFLRYYEVPGYGHGPGTVFNAAWDSVTALEDWVERGVAPVGQVVADTAGVPGRTRPLCEFPAWPRYSGAGDVNLAASFTCATDPGTPRKPSPSATSPR